ncbi:CC_3452 family protein [Sphingomonas sp.]|jgi:hypothetical protein|uniref:CC_3452 family protein n=1 Tax=Sphingomonas sp. TaxID=28214 RepID=UPI002EDA61FF
MKIVSNAATGSMIAAALFASATLFGATAAHAQAGAYYVATPVAAPAKPVITRSTSWQIQGASLVAAQAPERPAILCQLVADRAGPLAGFSVAGKPLDADALAKCNAKVAGRVAVAAK